MPDRDPAPRIFADADVLWGSLTTNLLMTLASRGTIELKWSDAVLSEVRRTVLAKNPHARIDHRTQQMRQSLPDAGLLAMNSPEHWWCEIEAEPWRVSEQ